MAAKKRELNLGNIWLFSACTLGQLKQLRRQVEQIEVPTDKVLCEEGTIGREFFFIVEGIAGVKRNGRKIATLGPGGYFGELSLLDRKPRNATVISETGMTLLVLDSRRFNGVLDSMPTLAHKLMEAMAGRIRAADERTSHSSL